MARIAELQKYGQSVWYDNIRRGLIVSGELKRLIDDGVCGVTSNPTIFEKAIGGTSEYDEAIKKLVAMGKDAHGIFDALAIEDIQATADLLRPVFDRSGDSDGFVSIEVSPLIASDTERTVSEAKRLWEEVDRRNLMVKIPATPEGIPAVEEAIGAGLNINITLIFAIAAYEQVMEAYLKGLERRVVSGDPIDHISSVASFFVSRVDTLVDKQLDERIKAASRDEERRWLERLKGKAAIANARLAYERFRRVFESQRFAALKARGARLQRPLWASTSTKNPHYPDTMYVDDLIGKHTVNTMPPQTIVAFNDHGTLRPDRVEQGLDEARRLMGELAAAGIDMNAVTSQLIEEGVKSFSDSFEQLIAAVDGRRALIQSGLASRQQLSLDGLQGRVDKALDQAEKDRLAQRIWDHDTSLWKADVRHARVIKNRLGWLTVSEKMLEQVDAMEALASEIKDEGYRHVVLLGMGGSSLCVEVCRETYGRRSDYPNLGVLDSTDPATILGFERSMDPASTFYIVSTKSGGTLETLSYFKYFSDKVKAARGSKAGRSFVAITDPGTHLESLARENGFRATFLNPSDIGGRYSVLSYFGLVPMALMGHDVRKLLDRALSAEHACAGCVKAHENPGVALGVIMGTAAKAGHDKVTLICSPAIASFGYWVEQLLAESTGKEGTGLIPIEGEALGPAEVYGQDRLFVYLRLRSHPDGQADEKVRRLESSGQPVVTFTLFDEYDLGQEFFRWEMATAAVGSLLGIDAFDEPNVQESKDNTSALIRQYQQAGSLPIPEPAWSGDGLELFGQGLSSGDGLPGQLKAFFSQARPGDYAALMAYIQRSPRHQEALTAIRMLIRDRLKVATTLGYGPRFLHSTGQLHKGGPNTGVFLQITAGDAEDLPIPGESYTFGTLKRAQALGDLQSLERHGRRAISIDLGKDISGGLARLRSAIEQAI